MEDESPMELGPTPEIRELSAGHALFERMQEINDQIERRAYELFSSRGFMHGHHFDDWHRAESEILHPCPLKLTETETGFILRAEVSGFTEKDLVVRVESRRLFISGRRQEAAERTEGKTVYAERRTSQIFRVLDLPASVDPNEVDATLSDGVLEVRLSKASVGKKIPVLTKAANA
jgi:HSP20 family molecular chaperone IbpA